VVVRPSVLCPLRHPHPVPTPLLRQSERLRRELYLRRLHQWHADHHQGCSRHQHRTITNGAGVGVSASFTATLANGAANSSGIPTGTVQFYSGNGAIGSPVTINGGQATLNGYTFNAPQTAPLSAQYFGDRNFGAATSATLSVPIVAPGYTVTANPDSLTITRGSTGMTTLTFTSFGNYQGAATFSCSGLPAFATCTFTPPSLVFTGNDAVQTVSLLISTTAPQASVRTNLSSTFLSTIFSIPGIAFATLLFNRRRRSTMAKRGILMLIALACVAVNIVGCGSGIPTKNSTPIGPSVIQVNVAATATAGSGSSNLNQNASITVTIQ